MGNERRFGGPVVGGSSLLVIFAVLCLTVFALLGLSTVQAGGRLSAVSARAAADYYAADCQAEELFARLRAGETPEGVAVYDNTYSYVCPISETRALEVSLERSGGTWTVLRWQAVSTVQWEGGGGLDLWDGGDLFMEEFVEE